MTYSIYEYQNVTENGQPVEPAFKRTAAQATGAQVAIDPLTRFVAVVPQAAMNLRINGDGSSAAATSDFALELGKSYGFPVVVGGKTWLYGL